MSGPLLRVAVDATPLLGSRSGVGEFTAGVLGALAERDDVEVIAYAVTWRGRGQLGDLVPGGVRAVRRPMPARPLREAWTRASWPPIELWTGPIDVVHGTNFVVPPARRAGAVVSVHDLTPVHFPELANASTLAYPGLIQRALRRGALVHVDSAFVAAEVAEAFAVPPGRAEVVAPGVPPVAGGDRGAGRRLAGAERYVLALGTIEPRKDLPSLVQAFDRVADAIPDLRLVVAGADGWGVDAFDAAVGAARHATRIVRLGWVDQRDRADLLAGAAVFAFPSVYEGFGFPPLEAMVAGVPVVTTTAGSLPEVVGDGAATVPVGDVDALAAELHSLVTDGPRAAELVDRGRARAAEFSWSRCAEGLVGLYRRAAARHL